jgi:hypothetical protein
MVDIDINVINKTVNCSLTYNCVICYNQQASNQTLYANNFSTKEVFPVCYDCLIALKSLVGREKQIPNI